MQTPLWHSKWSNGEGGSSVFKLGLWLGSRQDGAGVRRLVWQVELLAREGKTFRPQRRLQFALTHDGYVHALRRCRLWAKQFGAPEDTRFPTANPVALVETLPGKESVLRGEALDALQDSQAHAESPYAGLIGGGQDRGRFAF